MVQGLNEVMVLLLLLSPVAGHVKDGARVKLSDGVVAVVVVTTGHVKDGARVKLSDTVVAVVTSCWTC